MSTTNAQLSRKEPGASPRVRMGVGADHAPRQTRRTKPGTERPTVSTTTTQTTTQAPKPANEFRAKVLGTSQPTHTPEDVLGAAQALAATGLVVEIRAAKATPADDASWVLVMHGKTTKSKIKAVVPETAILDSANGMVWLRTISKDDLPKPAPKEQIKAKGKGKAKASTPRTPSQPGTGQCLCGCGGATKSRFAMGHDARFYSWLAQFQVTGALPNLSELPAATVEALKTTELPEKKQSLKAKWLAK